MDLKIHLIFNTKDNEGNSLVDSFKQNGISVDYDEDFAKAIKRLEDPDGVKPDCILASELAAAHNYSNKFEFLAQQMLTIKGHVPDAKVILLLEGNPPEEFKNLMSKENITLEQGQEYYFDIDDVIKHRDEAKTCSKDADEETVVTEPTEVPVIPSKSQTAQVRHRDIKVLHADGHPELIETIKGMSGVEITGVAESREVFEARLTASIPDVVILSPDLPGEDDILELVDMIDRETRIILTNSKKLSKLNLDVLERYGVEILEEESIGALEQLIKRQGKRSNQEEQEAEPVKRNQTVPKASKPQDIKAVKTLQINSKAIDIKRAAGKAADNVSRVIQGTGDIMATAKEKMSSISIKIGTKSRVIPNLIAVAGVKAVGKTTVAVNLAAKLAEAGNVTALIDCSPDQDVYTWLKAPFEETGLYTALTTNESPDSLVWSPKLLKNLWVLTSDIEACSFIYSQKDMSRVVSSMAASTDYVIVDLPTKLDSAQVKAILQMAACIIIVADSDIAHTVKLQRNIKELHKELTEENRLVVVANNFDKSEVKEVSSIRAAVDIKEQFTVPAKAVELRRSIRKGIPLCLYDTDFNQVFTDIAEYIEVLTQN